jgi:shikimate kinase
MDLDTVIEETSGRSIQEIFATDGEDEFRRIEAETLKDSIPDHSHTSSPTLVLALGGGTVMTPECAELVHEKTVCIYLRASIDTLVRNLSDEAEGRPMLAGNIHERITELMAQRGATYESTAHIIIDIDGKSVEEVALSINDFLQRQYREQYPGR